MNALKLKELPSPKASYLELLEELRKVELLTNPLIDVAFCQAVESHGRQKRIGNGKTLEEHLIPITLALIQDTIAQEQKPDPQEIALALTHDVLEDDPKASIAQLNSRFSEYTGEDQSQFIDKISHLTVPSDLPEASHFADLEKNDLKALIVRLYDRTNNIFCCHKFSDHSKILKYCRDTEEKVLPLAKKHRPKLAERLEERLKTIISLIEDEAKE